MSVIKDYLRSGAELDGKYRYLLWRSWDDTNHSWLKWLMLNPSTADASEDDPTIKKCIKFAKAWGYGGIKVVNLFAFRETDSNNLKKYGYAELVGPHNNERILTTLDSPGLNIAAWGQKGKLWGRAAAVRFMLDQHGIRLNALKIANDGATPYHPLYLRDDSKPFELR